MIIYSYMKGACFEPVTDIQIKGNGSTIQPTMPASEHKGVYVHNSDDNRTYRSNGTDWMCQLEKKNINSSIVFKSKKVDGSEMELASINPLAEEDTEVWITASKIGAVDTSTFKELNQYVKGEQLDGNGGLVKEISDLNSQINNADNGIAKQISDLNTELDTKADSSALSSYYTKEETNNKLALKADNATLNDYYKKSETNVLLSEKVSTSDLIDDSGAIKDSKLPTNILRLNQDNKISLNHLPAAALDNLEYYDTEAQALNGLKNHNIQLRDSVRITTNSDGNENVMYRVISEWSAGKTFKDCFEMYSAGRAAEALFATTAESAQTADTAGHADTAGTANKVANNFSIQLGENDDHRIEYDGAESRNLVITPEAIGAAPANHSHTGYASGDKEGNANVANKTKGALSLKIDGKLIKGFSFNGSQNKVLEIPTPNHVCVKYINALTNGVITKDTHNCGNYPIVQAFNERGEMVQINISIGSDGAINWRQRTATKLEFHISGKNDTNIETILTDGGGADD